MNRYDFDAEETATGWLAWHQEVHKAKKTYAMFKGEAVRFGSEVEALREARKMHLAYLHNPIVGAVMQVPSIKAVKFAKANKHFKNEGAAA